jgi:hypothetical protein
MKSLFYQLTLLALVVGGILVTSISSSNLVSGFSNNTTLTPPPTPISENSRTFEFYGLSWCPRILCWEDFIVGETPIKEVYSWFNAKFSNEEFVISPEIRDYGAENNAIQMSSSIGNIVAFSDDKQPEPTLRGFSLSISPEQILDEVSSNAGQQLIERLTPNSVIKQYEEPTTILIGENYLGELNDSFIMMNYEEENFSILYWYEPADTESGVSGICVENSVELITLLIYSDTETDINTLLDELDDYFEFSWLPHVTALRKFDTTLYSEEEDVEGFVDQISEEDCISE